MRLVPRPKVVLFDLDRTLCDYDAARLARTRYAFEPHFEDLDRLEQAIDDALRHPTDGSEHFADILAARGISDPVQIEEARRRFIEDRYRGLHLFGDALEVIERVQQVARIGVVTNGPSVIQRPKIELLQLEAHVPVIVISEEVGVWKPDPAIFAIALEQFDVGPGDAVYVGDSPEHDIAGAHAAGLRAVWINRLGIAWPGARPPDAEIPDLYQLLPLLGVDCVE